MVCSIIDNCKCYAYSNEIEPMKYQFCGVRRGNHVIHCPEDECCAGGCPGQTLNVEPREPFRIIDNTVKNEYYILLILLLISVALMVVF